ncbi:hypothetical protein FG03116.1 [Paecilomyces variotii No. 5]|uniref:AB hydrolase-1 domain-containing protein n=1 Tax=Byssochlamys spectabilis (strain No. 5 / NBRC 109023) TaxID=1356009 RepID=V5FFB9_BYSSN|nr:hypothetical protein FG03116.1 [Paecilomyces variotii No. 5]
MASNKPTIVIVPGSFCPASLYDSLSEKLRKFGYEIIVGELPSVACEPPQPAATMEEDAAVFHQIIEKLCDQGKQVVIFAHSYGGTVANESAKSLSKTERDNQGKPGGIIKIVYLASIITEVGKARLSDFRPRYLTLKDDYLFLEPITGAEDIIGDVPFEQALKVTEKMPHHSAVSFSGLLTHAGYKWVPVVYILCEKDKVVPPEYQRGFIEVLREGTNKPVPTISLDSNHCPNISMPEELANVVQKAIVEL